MGRPPKVSTVEQEQPQAPIQTQIQQQPAQPIVRNVQPNLSQFENVQFVPTHNDQANLRSKVTGMITPMTYSSAMNMINKYPNEFEIV